MSNVNMLKNYRGKWIKWCHICITFSIHGIFLINDSNSKEYWLEFLLWCLRMNGFIVYNYESYKSSNNRLYCKKRYTIELLDLVVCLIFFTTTTNLKKD